MTSTIHKSISIGTVGNHFHCFCNDTGIRIFVTLLKSFNNRMLKVAEVFHRSVPVKSVFLVNKRPNFLQNKSNGVMMVSILRPGTVISTLRSRFLSSSFYSCRCIEGEASCLHRSDTLENGGELVTSHCTQSNNEADFLFFQYLFFSQWSPKRQQFSQMLFDWNTYLV